MRGLVLPINEDDVYGKRIPLGRLNISEVQSIHQYCGEKLGCRDTFSKMRNVEYSILLVMSELSTVRCDHALGLWIAGTRASSIDGELPWRCCGRWTVRWTAVKGSRDRSSDRASTPGSRAQTATEGGFLGLRHKTKEADGG